MEIWKDLVIRDRKGFTVEGVTEKYKISTYGRVWNKLDKCYVSQVLTGKPEYWYVNLQPIEGKRLLRRVHNIMGHTFLEEPECMKMTVDHIDRNKYNNSLWNLRWASRKEQAINRDVSSLLNCGTPVSVWIESNNLNYSEVKRLYDIGYKSSSKLLSALSYKKIYGRDWNKNVNVNGREYPLGFLLDRFNLNKESTLTLLQKGVSFKNIVRGYTETVKPLTDLGIELENCWYPSLQYICDTNVANCNLSTLKERLKIMSLKEAVSYDSNLDKYGFEYKGVVATLQGHCGRLGLSYVRVRTTKNKYGMTNIEALENPIKRVIKHSINGEVKRNHIWYETFNIPVRSANSYLNRSGTNRTFKDVLNHYGIDTSDMDIHPCDGDVIMINNPL